MENKINLKILLSIIILIEILFFIPLLISFLQQKSEIPPQPQINNNLPLTNTTITTSSKQEVVIFGLPIKIIIPKIGVEAVIEYVELTTEGAMDKPKNQANVAWYELGPRPGEIGSAVIAGHYGWKNKQASAFDELYKLRPGDKIYIVDDKGINISFTVSGNRRYSPNADATRIFFSDDEKSHLNLITCEGTWDKASESYSERLVIFADKDL